MVDLIVILYIVMGLDDSESGSYGLVLYCIELVIL
jgi:hypothetical protein